MEKFVDFSQSKVQVPVKNRFEFFNEKDSDLNNDSGRHALSKQISRDEFVTCTMDDKLVYMFDELRFIRNEQLNNNLLINKFQSDMNQICEQVKQVIDVTNTHSNFMKTLAYKSIDIEARSRRNNLIFREFIENTGENCSNMI
ncbi:hypothetical protein ACF0H5_001431 [Mactra antiquata]